MANIQKNCWIMERAMEVDLYRTRMPRFVGLRFMEKAVMDFRNASRAAVLVAPRTCIARDPLSWF